MKKVIHIVYNDKFTNGYIKFMKEFFIDYNHLFYVNKGKYDIIKDDDIFIMNNIFSYYSIKTIKEFNKADIIIVSGVLGLNKLLFLLPLNVLSKMYIQFWGGDFYAFRNIKKVSLYSVYKKCLQHWINNCKGIINLVPRDYDELIKIFPNNKPHYVGAVTVSSDIYYSYKKFLDSKSSDNKEIKIIVGNSATKENCHFEVFDILKEYLNHNIKIICPLSYGDKQYASEVINKGKEVFRDKFVPLTDYLEYDDFIKILAEANIGIFYNNRQQAMGTIGLMLKLGKKVYLKKDTSMWYSYKQDDIIIFNFDEVTKMSFSDFLKFDKDWGIKNESIFINRWKKDIKNWKEILN